MYFSKIRKSLPAAAILAVLLLGGAATDAAAFSVDVDSLHYNDASGHNLDYFSEDGNVVGNVLKNGVIPSYTDYTTYDWGVSPLSAGDLTLFLDTQSKNYPFAQLYTASRGDAVLRWSGVPGEAPAVNLDDHTQLYTVKLSNFADLTQLGDSSVIIGLGRDDLPSSYQAALRITWVNNEVNSTLDLILQAVVRNDQGVVWSSDPTLTTHSWPLLEDPAAIPAATAVTVTLSVDSLNNFSATALINSPPSADQLDSFLYPAPLPSAPVPGQISRSPDFLSFVALETANAVTIQLSASSYSVSENYGSATITATRKGGSSGQVEVNYATSNGTAIAGSDYTAASGTLIWADGDTANKTFTVPITPDSIAEPAETFTATLSAPTGGATLGTPASATVTIYTPAVQFQIESSSGDKATTPAVFTVILPAPLLYEVTVDYATADGTATAPSDYTSTSGTLIFAPGQTIKTIAVPINPAVVGPKTFILTLSNPSDVILGTWTTHTYTITEPTVQFQSGPSAGSESTTPAVFVVTLSSPSAQTVTVDYDTADGTATAPWDYATTIGTLTFAPGDTRKTIEVTINDDLIPEENKTFTVTLSNPTGGVALGTPAMKTVTIIDDDTPPTVQFQSGSSSGNEPTTTTYAVFTVTLSASWAQTVTVSYATADGTAEAGSDYTSKSGVLTFFPGETSQTIAVPILPDAAVEGSETFTVTLLAAAIATLGTPTIHTYTITEETVTPTFSRISPLWLLLLLDD